MSGQNNKSADSRVMELAGSICEGEEMGFDINRAREVHFAKMQKVLEEGLTNINLARTPAEADAARLRAQARLEDLNQRFEEAFPKEDILAEVMNPGSTKQPV